MKPRGAPAPAQLPRRAWYCPVLLSVLLSAWALSGCGGGERIRDLYFSLEPEVLESAPGRSVPGTLRVTPLSARGFIGGSRIVYRTAEEPLEVKRYGQLLWEEVPARVLADQLTASLRSAGVFEHVISSGDPARPDFLLTGELVSFEHRPTDSPPHVLVELRLTLVRGKGRQVLVSGDYGGTEPTAVTAGGKTTPAAVVDAFNRLSGRLIGEVIDDARALAIRI